MSEGEASSSQSSGYISSPSNGRPVSETATEVAFDLSDPDDLERKLSDLTEEEMDDLLQQALKVNAELHKELKRQERTGAGKSSSTKGRGSTSKSLPPLRVPSSGSARRPPSFTQTHNLYSATAKPNSCTRKPSTSSSKSSKSRAATSSKPQWDDRFGV